MTRVRRVAPSRWTWADGHRLRAEAGADPALVRDLLAALLDRWIPVPSARACGWPPPHGHEKGHHKLAALVQDHLHRDPFSGQAFVFLGRAGTADQGPVVDGQGLCLFSKRLEKGDYIARTYADA